VSTPDPESSPEPERTPAPVKKKKGGKAPGAQKFTERDETRLLSIVEEVLPIGGDMWEKVSKRSKEQRPTRTTVERLRTPREKITEQISQRDKIMTQVSSALERSNATDLSSTLEKVSIIQMLQNQVQAEQARCRQLEVDYRALREKYDTKVAEVQEKAAEISKLELRLFMAGVQTPQARNGTPGALPWSSPVGNRGPGLGLSNFVGDREEQQ
jgi:chromosome segregation ATPase